MYGSFNAWMVGLTLSASETIELAAGAGFGGVDLMVRDLLEAGDDPRALRTRMDGLGLRGGAFPMPVAWRDDREVFSRDLARLPRLADAAATLGLLRTCTWVMPETGGPSNAVAESGGDSEDGRDAARHRESVVGLHCDRLGAIARVLDRAGIRLGLEVIGVASARTGRGQRFVASLAELDATLATLRDECRNLGVCVDAWHLYAAGEAIEAGLVWGISRVVGVHVADLPAGARPDPTSMIDADRGLPGEHGAIDTRAFLERLKEAGYDGPVMAEPMPGCRSLAGLKPEQVVHRVAESLRSVWPGDGSIT